MANIFNEVFEVLLEAKKESEEDKDKTIKNHVPETEDEKVDESEDEKKDESEDTEQKNESLEDAVLRMLRI